MTDEQLSKKDTQDKVILYVFEKLFSGNWLLLVMFGMTACWCLVNGKMSSDAWLGLAGGVFTGYQMKQKDTVAKRATDEVAKSNA